VTLGEKGDTTPLGRSKFRGHTRGSRDDGIEIGDQILASDPARHMSARFLGKRCNLFLLEDDLYFFTLHGPAPPDSSFEARIRTIRKIVWTRRLLLHPVVPSF